MRSNVWEDDAATQSLITPQVPSETKIAQVLDLVRYQILKSGIGDDGLEELIEAGDEFQQELETIFTDFATRICLDRDSYKFERVEPNPQFNYDTATLPKPDEQVKNQLKVFGLAEGSAAVIPWQCEMPPGADGLSAIWSLSDLGKVFEIVDPLGEGFGSLVEKVLKLLGASVPKFHNYCNGQLASHYVRLYAAVKVRWEWLEATQPIQEGKIRIFLLPINTGNLYQGFSSRNARLDALNNNRFPLEPVAVACILAAWPERLIRDEQLIIDCPGAKYSLDDFESNFCFSFFDETLVFDEECDDDPCSGSGTAVAFLPKCLF